MPAWLMVPVLSLLAAAEPDSVADRVTLRDGAVILGQVLDPSPKGTLVVVVRRAWADSNLPELSRRWQASEISVAARAMKLRRDRLIAWRRDRAGNAAGADPISSWIDHQLKTDAAGAGERPPLTIVRLSRSEVRTVERRSRQAARWLRQGWLAGFPKVESMPSGHVRDALEGLGYALGGDTPVSIDPLLPVPLETDAQWLLRRAATEVTFDSGLRFIERQGIVFPEPAPGQAMDLGGVAAFVGQFKRQFEDERRDPIQVGLREVGERGRVGAVVTRFDLTPDMATVTVETTLWVRHGLDRWVKGGWRQAAVETRRLGRDAGADLADDPQVRAAFQLVEGLGFGKIPDDVKRQSLNIGAATRQALSQARTAMAEELARLALPVRSAPGK